MATATKTDPAKWEQAKRDAKARMGGKHSARAMQLATQLYKKRGGGYSGSKPTAKNNSLKKWGKQKWQWSGGEKKKSAAAVEQGGRGVYLPEDKIKRLKATKEGKKRLAAAAAKKSKATREGEQYSSHGLAAGTSLKKRASMNTLNKLAMKQKLKTSASKRDPRLERAGVSGYNKPKRTPGHPTKSHIVVAKEGDRVKTIRFGQQGVKTNQTAGQRKAFKSRHRKNIAKGRMSAAFWADKAKWSPSKTKDKDNQKWVKGTKIASAWTKVASQPHLPPAPKAAVSPSTPQPPAPIPVDSAANMQKIMKRTGLKRGKYPVLKQGANQWTVGGVGFDTENSAKKMSQYLGRP